MHPFKVGDRVQYLGIMHHSRKEYIGEVGTVTHEGDDSCSVTWDNKCPGIGHPRYGNLKLADETDNIPEKW